MRCLLIEYLQRGQTGCERLQPKRRKIISSASPVSRIQLPPLCSWTKYKSIVMSFLYNGSLQMRNMHNPFPLVAPRTITWCIFASFLSKIAFQAFMSFLLCWGCSFTKPFLKECRIPTLLPFGIKLTSILCPHMVKCSWKRKIVIKGLALLAAWHWQWHKPIFDQPNTPNISVHCMLIYRRISWWSEWDTRHQTEAVLFNHGHITLH